MEHDISCVSLQDAEDVDNALQTENKKEQNHCDTCRSIPERCRTCASKTQRDPPPVPTIPPSPPIHTYSAFLNLPAELLQQVIKLLPPVPLMS